MPLFNDGGSHTVNSAVGTVTIRAATTVTFATGADVVGDDSVPATPAYSTPGVDSSGASTIIVNDGSIRGGSDSTNLLGLGYGVVSVGDSFTMTGGTIVGGTGDGNGMAGVYLFKPTVCSISGGTVSGEPGVNIRWGTALVLSLTTAITATITGGAFNSKPGSDLDYSIGAYIPSGSELSISGGFFNNTIALLLTGTGKCSFHGTGLNYVDTILRGDFGAGSFAIKVISLGAAFVTSGTSTDFVFGV